MPTPDPVAALVNLSGLREKHDPVARNLVTVWRSELLTLIEIAEAAHAFLASGDETQAHARLNAALDLIDFGADRRARAEAAASDSHAASCSCPQAGRDPLCAVHGSYAGIRQTPAVTGGAAGPSVAAPTSAAYLDRLGPYTEDELADMRAKGICPCGVENRVRYPRSRKLIVPTSVNCPWHMEEDRLPKDLARVLRDPTITIPRDHEIKLADGRSLFDHLQEWRNAPSNTASGGTDAAA